MYNVIHLILITMHRFKELDVWKLSVDMVEEIYKLTDHFPRREHFGIVSQIRRSVVSIPSNIAEGAGKSTNGDFSRFISIASGSCNELETQLVISKRLLFLAEEDFEQIVCKLNRIQKMLFRLQQSLRST
ncbi:MAG: four helix bundle protein [Bacteroidales bacterium]|nr:four helix bundle protein [Bacteroidales bacterium]